MFEQPADFLAESDALYRLLETLPDAAFDRPTRFKQWTINHVLGHLHTGNWAALETIINEPGYLAFRAERKAKVPPMSMREYEKQFAGGLQGRELLKVWHDLYPKVARTFEGTDPKRRLKWAGPDMSARSSISARLMETWAHGQAVYDLLGVERQDGDRLRNIVVLGINTFGWTFTVHEQPVPPVMPQVRLTAPSGAAWNYGEPSEVDFIEGDATQFCQVVTQVRNIADTSLRVVGPVASRWMAIAQAFAGPPETPPPPGTRFRETTAG
ncbi:MAG TPA: TIGR03084 family metal-binding protein [Burkholderiaceae bacterium]|nr:TIGR03084 family metal-binding protein [Burkholderiaceae bacterium]